MRRQRTTSIPLLAGLVSCLLIPEFTPAEAEAPITVQAEKLQTLDNLYLTAPDPTSPPTMGLDEDVVDFRYVRLRAGEGRYLAADKGGGSAVRLSSRAPEEEIFQVAWLDVENKIARIRTANGWHLLALRADKTIDARSADPADPDTVLHLRYNGDGTHILETADDSTKERITGSAKRQRLQLLSKSRSRPVSVKPTVFKPLSSTDAIKRFSQKPLGGTASLPAPTPTLTLFHTPGLDLRTYTRDDSRRKTSFYFEKANPPPTSFGPGGAEGPEPKWRIDLAEVTTMQGYVSGRSVGEGPAIHEILGIKSVIWSDINLTSGIYYFLPAAYYLRWDPISQRYDLSLAYGTATGEASPGVDARAVLTPRFTPTSRRAAEILVRQAALAQGLPFFELRQMPIDHDATRNSVADALATYEGVSSVVVRAPDTVMGKVEVGWQMPTATLEDLLEHLRIDQVSAPELTFQPSTAGTVAQQIPLYLSWEEPAGYPAIRWQDGDVWANALPHPVRFRGLHALVVDQSKRIQVVSWDLTGTPAIASGGSVAMEPVIPPAVSDKAFLTWVDYRVVPDAASIETAARSIMGGVSEQARQPLRITLLDPLAATGAQRIRVFIRSPYLEPGGDGGSLGIYDFETDGETRSIPFYFGRSEDQTPYEWTASVIMPDGEAYEGGGFVPGDRSLELLVSSSALRKIFEGKPWETSQP